MRVRTAHDFPLTDRSIVEGVEFVDECTLHAKGGRGGNGAVSFRREAHVPRGGPDGGDGGRGGDVVLVADRGVTSLLELHRRPHRRAPSGGHGSGMNKTGADADDLEITVPLGTVVRDHQTGGVLADLTRHGQRYVAGPGGRGGRGNTTFANRYRRVPKFAERGEETDEYLYRLELKVIADVGLVGFPSAGKSSLIARISGARPRVEAWPFTTLTPHLGVVRAGDDGAGRPIDIVLADVPGLIEGASEGRGLGHRFLRHIERCNVLLHVLDCAPFDASRDPLQDLAVIREELRKHDPGLLDRHEILALNKMDLPDGVAMADMVQPGLEEQGFEVLRISAVSGEGLDALRYRLGQIVAEQRAISGEGEDEAAEPTEVVIRLPRRSGDFDIVREPDGAYRVAGRRIERWVQMLPIENPDAARYLQGRLRRAGVDRALVKAGARAGDDVVIGDAVFDFEPELNDLPVEEREAVLAGELDEFDEDDWEDLDDAPSPDEEA